MAPLRIRQQIKTEEMYQLISSWELTLHMIVLEGITWARVVCADLFALSGQSQLKLMQTMLAW